MSSQTMTLDQTIECLAKKAKANGIDIEVLGLANEKFAAAHQKGHLDKFDFSTSQSLGIRVIDNGREACSYTEDMSPESVTATFEEARDSAKFLQKNYEPQMIEPSDIPKMDWLYNSELANITVAEKLELSKKTEQACLDYDSHITNVPYSTYTDFTNHLRVFNTKGVDCEYKKNGAVLFAMPLAENGDNKGMSLGFQVGRDFSAFDPQYIANEGAKGAVSQMNGKKPDSMKAPVVFLNKAANTFMGAIASHFSAESVDKKVSAFGDKLNQKVFSDCVSIIDDPMDRLGLGARPFDSEGAASQRTTLVENGQLKAFLTNSVYAHKMGLPHTANASRSPETDLGITPSTFCLQAGDKTLEDLLAAHPTVVLIESLKGMAGFNRISGNFSVESTGYLYKNGQLEYAIKNFVLSGNAFEALAHVEAVGNDLFTDGGSGVAPSFLVSELTIAGK